MRERALANKICHFERSREIPLGKFLFKLPLSLRDPCLPDRQVSVRPPKADLVEMTIFNFWLKAFSLLLLAHSSQLLDLCVLAFIIINMIFYIFSLNSTIFKQKKQAFFLKIA